MSLFDLAGGVLLRTADPGNVRARSAVVCGDCGADLVRWACPKCDRRPRPEMFNPAARVLRKVNQARFMASLSRSQRPARVS